MDWIPAENKSGHYLSLEGKGAVHTTEKGDNVREVLRKNSSGFPWNASVSFPT